MCNVMSVPVQSLLCVMFRQSDIPICPLFIPFCNVYVQMYTLPVFSTGVYKTSLQ